MSAKPTLNSDQKEAFKAIQFFLEHPSANAFVLKGYAGTGKTFLMQQLGEWLTLKEKAFVLLASTGRAAAVLKGKTGFTAKTVHGELYNFSKVDGISDEILDNTEVDRSGQMSMQFTARIPDEGKRIYIIDEASMLSGDATKDLLFARFGSGVLLNDFFEVIGSNKVIFVGDPCQLPPINQSISPALDTKWLTKQNRVAMCFTLEKIERVDPSNDILTLAYAVRNMSQQKEWELYPKLPASKLNNVKLYSTNEELFKSYFKRYKENGVNNSIAIARSNKMVNYINKAMRRDLYGSSNKDLQIGEILLVTQNNYSVPLTNGDFVEVIEIKDNKSRSNLHFRGVRIKPLTSENSYDILLSLDALYSIKGTLNNPQMERLMMDFSQRMRTKNISPNTAEYKKAMLDDEFLNCLKATYGYGVTCHKAQGGEWDDVFLFLDNEKNGMYNMDPLVLCKWWYTSITRAKKELNLVKEWWIE